MGPTRVEGGHSIQSSFNVPTQEVRILSRVVHPGFQNGNLVPFLYSEPIALAGRHVKVRRTGYGRRKI